MNKSPAEAGIPLLTEVIPGPPVLTEVISAPDAAAPEPVETAAPLPAPTLPAQPEPAAGPELQAPAETDLPAADLSAQREQQRWAALERELGERVLQQLLHRVDTVLEQRVRDSLADVLQLAVDQLASDIRSGLRQSLKEAIGQAVAQEIEKLKASEF